MNKRIFLIFITIFVAIVLSGAVSATTQNNTTCSDPIINGTVTISEYGNVRPLPNATITVNSTGSNSRVLGTTTTDANGYYSINFYSANTQFLVTASYLGCNSVTKTVNVSQSSNPQDPNYYGTSNIQLTPKTATWNGQMGYYSSIYITYYDGYYSAGELKTTISGDSATYNAYCIDIYTTIHSGGQLLVNGPLPGTTGDLSDQVDWDKVNYIISHYAANSNLEGAAIQAAIWYFTSAPYGAYPGTDPNHPGYYQFMTNPNDAKTSSGGTTIRNRAWEIINSANSMNYPSTVTLEPEITRVENGSNAVITATVRDQNGNPLQNITVNFTTDKGSLSYATRTTNANGQASVTLSNVGDNSTATVTAYVTGKYGTLLYDDVNNPLQNLVCAQLLPYTLSDTSTINFDRKVDVQITQTVDKPVANVGDTVNFTITARNTHSYRNATGIIIEDIIPEGLSNVTVIPSVGTFYNNLWVIPSLAGGATATLNIIGTVTASMAGLTVTNTATRVSQDQYNSLPAVASASVYTKMAMVDIDETVNTPVNVGDTVTYVVSVTNNGPDTATNIVVEDNPPCCLNNLTITPSVGTYENGIWTIPSLASGATATLTISGIATAVMAGCCTPNTATIINQTEYDPHTIGESVTRSTYTKLVDISISHTSWYSGLYTYTYGSSPVFTVRAMNSGQDEASGVVVEYKVGDGFEYILSNPYQGTVSYDPETRIITWNIGDMPVGGRTYLYVYLRVIETGDHTVDLTNTASLKHVDQDDQDDSNDEVSRSIYVAPSADVQIDQTMEQTNPELVTITIIATNNGPNTANGIEVSENIPSELFNVTVTPSVGSYNNGIWYIPSLEDGDIATLIIQGTINQPFQTIKNTATRTRQNETDWNLNNNSKTCIIGESTKDIDISISHTSWYSGLYTYTYGSSPVFTVRAMNSGQDEASGVVVEYKVGDGFEYILSNPYQGTVSYDPETRIITWNIGDMPVGGRTYLYVYLRVIETGDHTVDLTNTASLKHVDQDDQDDSNDEVSRSIYVAPSADVQIDQTMEQTNPELVTITIIATNNGPNTANGIEVSENIPSELFNVTVTPSVGSYNNGIWYIPSLEDGDIATLIIQGTINQPFQTIKNTATRTRQNETDWNLNNNSKTIYF